MQRCREYIEALEEERRKIRVFQRELPLSLDLVTQAIESYRQQMSGTIGQCFQGQSEWSEQISSGGPVLEEFIPIKRASSYDGDDEEEESLKPKKINAEEGNKTNNDNEKSLKKSEWLRSVQLWNQSTDPAVREGSPNKVPVMEVRKDGGGAFHPFKREKRVEARPTTGDRSPTSATAAAASSTRETAGSSGGESKKEEKEGQSQRKARRCWSPELHRRFLHALQQLGGSHVATPKQIRELMKVDGLTNDEVKSHLQKYRLHTRTPTPPVHNTPDPQPPQFVVVGGIWVPPLEYTTLAAPPLPPGEAAASQLATPKGIYPPPPFSQNQQLKQSESDLERGSHSEGGEHSHSPATSSSTRTSTASPAS